MKEKHNYLQTSIWYREKIKDPYQVIAAAFDYADITFYRKMILKMLQSVQRKKIYSKTDPGHLLSELGKLESVINAAYFLMKEKKTSPLEIVKYQFFTKSLYCSRHLKDDEW